MHTRKLIGIALLAVTGGCVSQPQIDFTYYEPPTSGPMATIIGEDHFAKIPLLLDNNTIYIEVVDGRRVRDARSTGMTPLSIAAGKRRVIVAQRQGTFSGGFSFDFEAAAGVAYRARHERVNNSLLATPLGSAGGPTLFWIEEAHSGKLVTEKAQTYVSSNYKTPVPIFVPK